MRWLRLFAFFLLCGTALAQGPGIQNPPTNIAGGKSPCVAVVSAFNAPCQPGIAVPPNGTLYIAGSVTTAAADDAAGILYVSKSTNYTGTSNGSPPAIYGANVVGQGVQGIEAGVYGYTASNNTMNSQPAGTAGAVGTFGIGACSVANCSATWGMLAAMYDSGNLSNPPNPEIGLEVDNYAYGADANGAKVGIQINCSTPTNSGTLNTCGHGILISGNGAASTGQYVNVIDANSVKATNGVLLGAATLSGVAYNSPGFQVDNVGNIIANQVTINAATQGTVIINKSASGQVNVVQGETAGSLRWQFLVGDATAEGGSNAGSNFALSAYSDAGGFLSQPLIITRATGAATFSSTVSATQHLTPASLPVISACGSGTPAATAGSSNSAGQITIGTGGTVTSCTATFVTAYPNTAFCTVSPVSSTITAIRVSAQSKSAFTVTFAPATASQVFQYTCGGN